MSDLHDTATPEGPRPLADRGDPGLGRADISSIFVVYGLVFSLAWFVLVVTTGKPVLMMIGVLPGIGFSIAFALRNRVAASPLSLFWLAWTNMSIFLAAIVSHPAAYIAMMLIPMAGVPFVVFALPRERLRVIVMTGMPFALWLLWYVARDFVTPVLTERTASGLFALLSAVTAFAILIIQLLYYAEASARYASSLKSAQRAAEQASRAKSVFLSGISHEMRTPLHAVIGMADLIRNDPDVGRNPQQADYARHIIEAGQVLLRTLEKTVKFAELSARSAPVQLAPVGLSEVIKSVLASYCDEAARRAIRLEGPETGAIARANSVLVHDALSQLVENAIRYSNAGGTVQVGVGSPRKGWLRLTVEDEGPGFGPAERDMAFTPFERLGHAAGTTFGAGMGLPIARINAEAMGGSVSIDPDFRTGARVWIDLPEEPETSA